ncbi:hypothetical protein LINPERHAP2_LOCUS2465 [Linum perenne]
MDDRALISVLGSVTVVALVITDVGVNVLVVLIVGVAIVAIHGTFIGDEDLFVNQEGADAFILVWTLLAETSGGFADLELEFDESILFVSVFLCCKVTRMWYKSGEDWEVAAGAAEVAVSFNEVTVSEFLVMTMVGLLFKL